MRKKKTKIGKKLGDVREPSDKDTKLNPREAERERRVGVSVPDCAHLKDNMVTLWQRL